MRFSELLRVAWEGISRNKLRSLLTMLGVIIGVAAVIIMIAISAGTEATIADQIETLGSNLLFVTTSFSASGPGNRMIGGDSGSLTYDDAIALGDTLKNVSGVLVERNTSRLKAGSSWRCVNDRTPDYLTVREIR
jgi:putative ABC transport system permease protein